MKYLYENPSILEPIKEELPIYEFDTEDDEENDKTSIFEIQNEMIEEELD